MPKQTNTNKTTTLKPTKSTIKKTTKKSKKRKHKKVTLQMKLDKLLISKFKPTSSIYLHALQYTLPNGHKITAAGNESLTTYKNLLLKAVKQSAYYPEILTSLTQELGNTIGMFRGENYFLSNMYECPVTYKGVQYKSSESAYQSQKNPSKTTDFKDLNGFESKKHSKYIRVRNDWDSVKLQIMNDILHCKFEQNPELKTKLIETGKKNLIEGNIWGDRYWGVCRGEGQNHLGRLLMNLREELCSSLMN